MITVSISNRQKTLPVDRRRIRRTIQTIVRDANLVDATIGVAVVDDAAIAELHRQFLDDPTPTDALSFVLERSETGLEGEVAVSADTALRCAPRYRTTAEEELLRYIIHGVLHLVGYDDRTPSARAVMRKQEKKYLIC